MYCQSKNRDIDFDVETAIKVCRSAGYYKHALYLAEKHSQHNWYLKIQLEDIKDYENALDYMATLQFEEVTIILLIMKYSNPQKTMYNQVKFFALHNTNSLI